MTDDFFASLSLSDRAKYAAARRSVDLVEDGMKLGLGTGSTAYWMVHCLAERQRNEGIRVMGVPTSSRTAAQAREEGIEVVSLEEAGWLDLTIDGADEFDAAFNLIKGGGGAHLQEKIVATSSDRMVVISDPSKEVATLGAFPLPVEVTPFGWAQTVKCISAVLEDLATPGREAVRRMVDGRPFVTDEGNFTIDLHLQRIDAPQALAAALNNIPGVVETGLFLDICDTVIIGRDDGSAELREKTA